MMLHIIRRAVKWVLGRIPGGNYIVFESSPDLSDNTKAVFDEMLRRGLHKKYRFYWWVNDRTEPHAQFPNTRYLDQKTFWNNLLFRWITMRAKCLICCNRFLYPVLPPRKSFYLTHGTALKRLHGYTLPEKVSYTLVASEHVREVMAQELKGDISNFYGLGFPRNDALQQPGRDLHSLLPGEFKKVVVWYPTFRQHKNGVKTDSQNALPVLHDAQSAVVLNNVAKESGILLVVKPHFAQDISYITKYDLSNIRFIDDSFFVKNNLSSYEFVGSCDALITDYSSIYFDYLLCDKPIAVIWEDIEDYRKNPGFAMDPDVYMKGSHKIYTLEDFQQFLWSVSCGEDPYREERNQLNALLNYASDGKNAQRVTEFIIEKANL